VLHLLLLCLLLAGKGKPMPENNFYSGAEKTVTVPIYHAGDDNLHQIEVPANTPIDAFHDALLRGGYHENGPTDADAEENTEKFRDAARESWQASGSGTQRKEAGFVDPGSRLQYPNQDEPAYGTHLKQAVGKSAFAALHTHPNANGGQPSQQDIDDAKKVGKPYYVVSKEGLFMVRPSDGAVVKVFDGTGWMSEKRKR
jgi:hypothetical protein